MDRSYFFDQIDFQFSIHSVCGLLGPRQIGKTTLAHEYAKRYKNISFFDLEKPFDRTTLIENPYLTLSSLNSDLIIIDEVQFAPDLFQILRVIVDEKPSKILVLGSASRDLIRQSSESLAGRIGYIELPTFSLSEVEDLKVLWSRGGFPLSYLAANDEESYEWRDAYITTFLERDIPNMGFAIPPHLAKRLWTMLAHVHGNILNNSMLAKSLMISQPTVRKYIDILMGTFMIRTLQPWFENTKKRQIKSPKVFIRDSGIFHKLLNIKDYNDLLFHPQLGASWEGFALEEVIKHYKAKADECFFWGTQAGAELDLLIVKDRKKLGFEFKYTDVPKLTKSMQIAIEDLKLDHLYVVHPQSKTLPLAENVTAMSIYDLCKS